MSKQTDNFIKELKYRVDQFARDSRSKITDHVVNIIKSELMKLPKTIKDKSGNVVEGIMTPDQMADSVKMIESEEGLEKLEANILVIDQDALMSIDAYNKYLNKNIMIDIFAKAKMTTEVNIQKIVGI